MCVAPRCGMLFQTSVVKSQACFGRGLLVNQCCCFCVLNRSLLLSPSLTHALTCTHTCITHYVLFVDMPFLVHIIPICFAKSGWFSHFCLLSLPMESNFCIHNSSAQWGPCNEFYLATMFMFLLTLADNFTALCVCAHIILT